ncbi:TlpA family protein disulfide reductase [Marmoricola sp. RAF53]|uniref:TlpA family protein disulfide reductase n=1 Tax=Marmoricola sp. RAF53 TaxID=3233059 RepID=UPI003F9D3EE4
MKSRWMWGGLFVALLLMAWVLLGCGSPPPHSASGQGGVNAAPGRGAAREGWAFVDLSMPGAAARMDRIGERGPRRLDLTGATVVNFWASSCAPCRAELPWLERLSRAGVRVVGVSRDNKLTYAAREMSDRGVTFANYSDASADVMFGLRRVLIPNGIPTTVIVRDGRVRWVHIGAFTSYRDLRSEIQARLD